ncbi:protein-tyrosine phosphatase [Nocardia bhagyanarayanae]|uniref:Protein-tyrosine phosphatase n=2 Tax=Nocardia bhagyanarayanae TaxID=1215925 RepID=A0A543EW97_9NOCA|nr:protein-tyrosine phosphatase [Nocardia bhagyanarayanae]
MGGLEIPVSGWECGKLRGSLERVLVSPGMKISFIALIGAAFSALALVSTPLPPSAVAEPTVEASATRIELQGAVNVRDIGGYRTYDGARVKSGKAFRADSLEKLTEADVQKLGTLNLRAAVDLRTPAEVQFAGPDKLPAGVQAVARPIDDTGLFQQMLQAIQSRDPQKQEELLGGGRAEQIMAGVYRSFLSEASRNAFGQTIRDLANSDRATLYHCTAGKDRTGWLTYVVLRAVGVPESTARQDYLLSNQYRAAADAKLREQVKQAGLMQNPDLLIPLQEVRDAYLNTAIQQMEQSYGDFGKFLTQGLGLDPGTILKLRKNLVS